MERNLFKRVTTYLSLLVFPHILLICNLILQRAENKTLHMTVAITLTVIFFLAISLYITKDRIGLSLRLKIMMGGRRIYLDSLIISFVQVPFSLILLLVFIRQMSMKMMIFDTLTTYSFLFAFQFNGALRIFFTSKRLGVGKRVFFLLFSWVPFFNLISCLDFCRIVKKEYQFNFLKEEFQATRISSQICKTAYPLLMLHGFGFRDGKYIFNYWGRIPKTLKKNGATVYYGKQQANASIEENARDIKMELKKIIAESGCQKVNIIAHSKGGLDARYMISTLGMADKVATLTTVSTPHRGSELVVFLKKLPDKKFRKICSRMDASFRKLGDKNPNTYVASHQLSPGFMKTFNLENPDLPQVYYQSYSTKMKSPTSCSLLMLPNLVMKYLADDNDGLVTTESAQWGNYMGSFKSSTHRGISHADQIDLFHRESEGFDIQEEYVKIVSQLKKMGF